MQKTNCMEKTPSWGANSHSATQIPRILWNMKVHYHVHKDPRLVPTWIASIHSTPCHPISLTYVLILSSYLRLGLQSGPSPTAKILYPSHLSYACYIPFHLILDLIILIIFGEAYKLRNSSLCCLLHPPATSSLLGPNILNALFSDNLSLEMTVPQNADLL